MRGHSPRRQRGAARWVDAAARLGHVATGSVYIIVGVVAALACVDARLRPLGTQGALHRTLKGELGAIALLAIELGLTADAVWQMIRAAVDADRVGPGITGATNRVAWIVTGVTHFGLAIAAFKIALGIRQSTAETGVKRWTELPGIMRAGIHPHGHPGPGRAGVPRVPDPLRPSFGNPDPLSGGSGGKRGRGGNHPEDCRLLMGMRRPSASSDVKLPDHEESI